MLDTSNILVIGGSSKLAQRLRRILPAESKYVSRSGRIDHGDTLVDDYANADEQLFQNISVIINCVGTAKGSRQQLDRVNVDSAVVNLEKAITAGAEHFIQISSFSVYGRAEMIDKDTSAQPEGPYGESKLEAERNLLRVADNKISVTILRLPMLYDDSSPSKLLSLLKLWRRVKFLPVPTRPVLRSMMSYTQAAKIIGRIAKNRPKIAILTAADPEPFNYKKVRAELALHLSKSFGTLFLPNFFFTIIKAVLPMLYKSMYRSSVVSPNHNYAVSVGLQSTLYSDIRLMVSNIKSS